MKTGGFYSIRPKSQRIFRKLYKSAWIETGNVSTSPQTFNSPISIDIFQESDLTKMTTAIIPASRNDVKSEIR